MTKAQQQFKQWLSNQDNKGLNNIILPATQVEQLTEITFSTQQLDKISIQPAKELNKILFFN